MQGIRVVWFPQPQQMQTKPVSKSTEGYYAQVREQKGEQAADLLDEVPAQRLPQHVLRSCRLARGAELHWEHFVRRAQAVV